MFSSIIIISNETGSNLKPISSQKIVRLAKEELHKGNKICIERAASLISLKDYRLETCLLEGTSLAF